MDSSIPQHHPLRSLFETLTERAFTEKLGWPDFTPEDLEACVRRFHTRERRFGGLTGLAGQAAGSETP